MVNKEQRDALVEAIQDKLDTRDKRFMFLWCMFKEIVRHIQIEGSAHETAWNIYFEFEKRQMVGSLMACMNSVFNLNLQLTYDI